MKNGEIPALAGFKIVVSKLPYKQRFSISVFLE